MHPPEFGVYEPEIFEEMLGRQPDKKVMNELRLVGRNVEVFLFKTFVVDPRGVEPTLDVPTSFGQETVCPGDVCNMETEDL